MKNLKLIITLIITLIIVTVANLQIDRDSFTFKVINNDVISYYAYLPATFIYNDVTLKFKDEDPKLGGKFWADTIAPGKYLIRTSMGMSVMYSPFFAAAHVYTKITGGVADGFSKPYSISLIIASIFYLLLGLFCLAKFLSRYFKEWTVLLTIFLIVFATNLFEFVTIDAAMSHAFSFSLISILLYATDSWYRQYKLKWAFLIGLLYGIITLIRPTNAIVAIIIPLWGIKDRQDIQSRISFFLKNYLHILIIIVTFILVWVPQLLYWHEITGNYIINSYSHDKTGGGTFFFSNPQIFNQFFSFRKGLLIYTPIIAFALIGMFISFKTHKNLFWSIVSFTLINIYVLSSWWVWWFNGGFGCRGYIDSYAIMAVGLAVSIEYFSKKPLVTKSIFFTLTAFFLFLNIFQTYQFFKGFIHYSGMSKNSYMNAFLNLHPGKEYYENLIMPDMKNAAKGIYYEGEKSFKEIYDMNNDPTKLRLFEEGIRKSEKWMKSEKEKAEKWGVPIDSVIKRDARWLLKKENEKKSK